MVMTNKAAIEQLQYMLKHRQGSYLALTNGSEKAIARAIQSLQNEDKEKKYQEPVDIGYLYDWYVYTNSGKRKWTEEHIEELFEDFILIPK
jgi:hypothetical protein